VGSDWDVEERARAALDSLGLEQVPLDRRISELSGGESVLLSLATQFLRRPDVLLLDEPTNNLDLGARHRLYDAAGSWTGAMVIVSHDRELLDRVDQIAELRAGEVRWYGGNLTDYEEALAAEQEVAERMVRVAEADVRRQKRKLIETRTKLDRRVRYGQKMQDTSRMPKIVANERKRQAQVSAGKFHGTRLDRLDKASKRLAEAEEAVRVDAEIRVDLPATAVPAGRTVLTLSELEIRYGARANLIVRGPERIALTGRNGAGKTTLLRTVISDIEPVSGAVKLAVPVHYLPQRLDPPARAACAAATAAGRADQQPRHGQHAPALRGTAVLPGRTDRGQPRRAVPARPRHHPLAPTRRRADRHRPALARTSEPATAGRLDINFGGGRSAS
jgi:ATPase subunit of ABC transporter with duplicated ATPase domains